MSAFRPFPISGAWDSLVSKAVQKSLLDALPISPQPTLLAEGPFCPVCTQESGNVPALKKGPWVLHALGWRTCIVSRGSEFPVVHLQLFQVCHQAKDSTVILRLAALKIGDGGDRTK